MMGSYTSMRSLYLLHPAMQQEWCGPACFGVDLDVDDNIP